MAYFPGETPAEEFDFEEEFRLALLDKSNVFKLVGHNIYNSNLKTVMYKEILLRGGLVKDVAPYQRILSMTEQEQAQLLMTQLQKFGHRADCTVNLTSVSHLAWMKGSKMVVEIRETIIQHVSVATLCAAKRDGIRCWADDVPFHNCVVMNHIFTLLPHLEGVKIKTADLAKAYHVPIIKDPIDNPDDCHWYPADPELKHMIDAFLNMLIDTYPTMKVILELHIPLEKLPEKAVHLELYIQGGPDGARAYELEEDEEEYQHALIKSCCKKMKSWLKKTKNR